MCNYNLPEVEEKNITKTSHDIKNLSEEDIENIRGIRFIGVGVGGLYIRSDILEDKREYVLLYKRYHDPEEGLLSIIGGSGVLFENIEKTLKDKFSRITKVNIEDIKVGNVIKVNNHQEDHNYHFVSPSYYIEVNNPSSSLIWGKIKKNEDTRKLVYIAKIVDEGIHSESITEDERKRGIIQLKELNNMQSTYKDPLLVWFPVDEIKTHGIYFAFTTKEAIKSYISTQRKFNKVIKDIKGL